MEISGLIGKVDSKNHVVIRLTKERWLHITTAHPEIDSSDFSTVLEIVGDPDSVLSGDKDELLAVKRMTRKKGWFVVVYREVSSKDGFILTAYITTDSKWLFKREVVWNNVS